MERHGPIVRDEGAPGKPDRWQARLASRGVKKVGELLRKLRSRHDDGAARIVCASLEIGLKVGAVPDHPYLWSRLANLLDQRDGIVRGEVEVKKDQGVIRLYQTMPHRSG